MSASIWSADRPDLDGTLADRSDSARGPTPRVSTRLENSAIYLWSAYALGTVFSLHSKNTARSLMATIVVLAFCNVVFVVFPHHSSEGSTPGSTCLESSPAHHALSH